MDFVRENINYNRSAFSGAPLLPYTIAFIYGILSARLFSPAPVLSLSILFSISSITLLLHLCGYLKKHHYNNSLIKTVLLFLMLLAGNSNKNIHDQNSQINQPSRIIKPGGINIKVIVKSNIKISRNSSYTYGLCKEYNEKLVLFIDKKFPVDNIEKGDTLFVLYRGKAIAGYSNDSISGWLLHLTGKGIKSMGYVPAEHISHIKDKREGVRKIINRLNRQIRHITDNSSHESGEFKYGLLTAIITGNKNFLDERTKQAFRAAGTMHLMAVSGFHASLIYLFTGFLLSFMGNYKIMQIIRALFILCTLWFYAAVAGFSPSVLRAVTMVTFYILAKLFVYRAIPLNILSASALLIAIFDPYSLYDTGFQLSYCAFLSIIFIYPVVYRLLLPSNRFIKWMWGLMALSLSCQAGTSLISIAKFGYFPVYFLVSNIIMVPLVTIILYLSVSSIVLLYIGLNATLINRLLLMCLELLTKAVHRIESLPFSSVKINYNYGVTLSIISLGVIYLFDFGIKRRERQIIAFAIFLNLIVCMLL